MTVILIKQWCFIEKWDADQLLSCQSMNSATHRCRLREKLSVKQQVNNVFFYLKWHFLFIHLFCLSSSFALLFVSVFFRATCDRWIIVWIIIDTYTSLKYSFMHTLSNLTVWSKQNYSRTRWLTDRLLVELRFFLAVAYCRNRIREAKDFKKV